LGTTIALRSWHKQIGQKKAKTARQGNGISNFTVGCNGAVDHSLCELVSLGHFRGVFRVEEDDHVVVPVPGMGQDWAANTDTLRF
jgi:hypothetical protein